MTATVTPQGRAPRISQTRRSGATVLRPVGALDRSLAEEIRGIALEVHGPVVVDLEEAVLVDAASVQRIILGWQFYRPPMCIVCRRPAARSLLQRAEVHEHVSVFESVEAALDTGGWRPRRP